MIYDHLYLWYLGDPQQPRYVGELRLAALGKGVSLRYGENWLNSGFALSEDLRLADQLFLPPDRLEGNRGPRAVGAVDDARPDRWGEKVIRCVDRPSRLSLMEYLYFAGDDRFGALGVSTSAESYEPKSRGPLPRLEAAQELSDAASKISNAEQLTPAEETLIAGGGSPLGGAKPKALIEVRGREWVIKFFNGESVDAPLIEHATMTLAKEAKINVASTFPIRLNDCHALAIERFDRIGSMRIHSISAGTALRAATPHGQEPDLGYPDLALLLRRAGDTQDHLNKANARELFRRMVFNILIDNTDDHEKNHALLITDPFKHQRLVLAPAYDVLPCNSGQGQQEFICGDNGTESTLENAMSRCKDFGMSAAEAAKEVVTVIAVVDTWQDHFRQAQVSDRDIRELSHQIDGAPLRSQRQNFKASSFVARKKASRKKNPFAPEQSAS
ncbi:type II toxin-antitoxin system HipA family toxin [Xanthomonas citri]|uniref:type II toxin-antitoxin system HipA family toxin n=1 Tax=Xanthomonas citri TaxID=346 RepID=UPI000418C4B4|nr:HipA domain-containing protein [Xanthomonas citri]ASN11387.1 phosphatidylinositol kinase [Xanthomonas citri pv. malvacearum]